MGRKKKKTIENLKVHGIADRGKAVARTEEGQVVFLDHAVPGDIVDALILRKKKGFMQGVVTKMHKASTDRIKPRCTHFEDCGGCKWQDMTYDKQVYHKELQVKAAISKIARIQDPDIVLPIIGSKKTFYYRNKMEYSFSNARWLSKAEAESDETFEQMNALGFHPPGFYSKVVDITTCFLQDDQGNEIRNAIRAYGLEHNLSFYDSRAQKGFLRNFILRNTSTSEWMLIMIFGDNQPEEIEKMMNFLVERFPFLKSVFYIINLKKNDSIFDQEPIHFYGEEVIYEVLGELKYKISPKSFFQTNSEQAKVLYDKIVEFADLQSDDHVYDLYTGLGSIALYVAKYCKTVLGIEEIPVAIEDAKFNMKLNEVSNASFYTGDVKDILTPEFIEQHPKPDVIITDPPRAGMHADVINTLLKLEPKRIVYVSCNPATQARDIALLSEQFQVIKVQPVDMFPHTHHVESIAVLERK